MPWAPDYATTAELRAYITRSSVTVDDTELALAVTAASRVVDEFCGRQFGSTAAEARVYTAEYDHRRRRWLIDTDDISAVAGLSILVDDDDDDTYDKEIDEYRLWPFNAGDMGRPWTRIIVDPDSTNFPSCSEGAVQVTAAYGWSAVPSPVKTATLVIANRIFQRRVSPFGIAGSPETGSELRLLRAVDVDAQQILQPYRRRWGAA
ncbi:MAG TPA: hypothetical protein VJQ57_10255, partial [Acidimicrobiia bacterium]|nr:hypothetical protein [Acidimicrobiia bacterium]